MCDITKLHKTCEKCGIGIYEYLPMSTIFCCNICGYDPNNGFTLQYNHGSSSLHDNKLEYNHGGYHGHDNS